MYLYHLLTAEYMFKIPTKIQVDFTIKLYFLNMIINQFTIFFYCTNPIKTAYQISKAYHYSSKLPIIRKKYKSLFKNPNTSTKLNTIFIKTHNSSKH